MRIVLAKSGFLKACIISLRHLVQSICPIIHGLAAANHDQKKAHMDSLWKRDGLVPMRIDGSNLPGHWRRGVLGSRTVGGGCRDCPL